MIEPKSHGSVLILVTARGGSVRLPGKNLRLVGGMSLVESAVRAGLASRVPHADVVCSTDSDEIAAAARRAGASVPFLRPPELSTSEASSVDAVLHALDWFETYQNKRHETVILLQPTSPMRTANHIDQAYALYRTTECVSLASVCTAVANPYKMYRITSAQTIKKLLEQPGAASGAEEKATIYQETGAIYIVNSSELKESRSFLTERTIAFVMDRFESLDVDTEEDLLFAEHLLARKRKTERP
jgi:CMP-N,N'-diacetyllegionaminic acid synthase